MMTQLTFDNLANPSPLALRTPDELYHDLNESLLRSLEEDRRLEHKPNSIQLKYLGEYISMWANTAPYGGLIVIGVRNDKTFEGVDALGTTRINKLERAAEIHCPDARCTSKRVPIHRDSDGQQDTTLVLRVEYHTTRVVRTADGKVFRRIGESKKQFSSDEIRLLQADKGEIRFETEAATLRYPDEYDESALRNFVQSVREDKQWSEEHSQEQILELLHLGRIDHGQFRPNVACALLFGRDPQMVVPGCKIRFLRFDGEIEGSGSDWNAVKDEMIEGSIPTQIQKTAVILESQLRKFSRLGKDGKFFTSDEYPGPAWYEALVNACAHRSYGNGLGHMTIFVKMFDDRLVIESPGPFPPFVTPENIYDVSIPRNPFLMEALRHLKFVKAAHEGTRRMRHTMQAMELPAPLFEQWEVGAVAVRVTLHNQIKHRKVWVDADVAALLGAQLARKLTKDQKRCLNFMAEHGEISVSDAARLSERKSWHSAKKMLLELVAHGVIEHRHREDLERDPKARFALKKVQPE